MIELPDGWLDSDHSNDLDFIIRTVKEEVERQVEEHVVTEVIKHTKLPKIRISPQEVKSRALDILAKRVLEK